MDRNYWEKIAPEYNEEIFDVLKNDRKGILLSTIKKYSSNKLSVIDIGCAIGKWLPVLSPLFKKVIAVDISQKNLNIARQLHPGFKNIEFKRMDMSDPKIKIQAADVGICINAILTGSLEKRTEFFKNLRKCIKKNGYLILVIPSLESSLLTSIIRQRWNPDQESVKVVNNSKSHHRLKNLLQGNVEIDQVPTKHYLKEELQLILQLKGFTALEFQKIEYDWSTEFLHPPSWLKQPLPWDWMVTARRSK